MIDLDKLQKEIYANKLAKGFNTTDIPREFCYLSGEVAEAWEAWEKKFGQEALGLELADVAIFLLGLSEILGISLEEQVVKKMAINAKRIYRDGKKIEA